MTRHTTVDENVADHPHSGNVADQPHEAPGVRSTCIYFECHVMVSGPMKMCDTHAAVMQRRLRALDGFTVFQGHNGRLYKRPRQNTFSERSVRSR